MLICPLKIQHGLPWDPNPGLRGNCRLYCKIKQLTPNTATVKFHTDDSRIFNTYEDTTAVNNHAQHNTNNTHKYIVKIKLFIVVAKKVGLDIVGTRGY